MDFTYTLRQFRDIHSDIELTNDSINKKIRDSIHERLEQLRISYEKHSEIYTVENKREYGAMVNELKNILKNFQ